MRKRKPAGSAFSLFLSAKRSTPAPDIPEWKYSEEEEKPIAKKKGATKPAREPLPTPSKEVSPEPVPPPPPPLLAEREEDSEYDRYERAVRLFRVFETLYDGERFWFVPCNNLTPHLAIDTGQKLRFARICIRRVEEVPVYVCSCDREREEELAHFTRNLGESVEQFRQRLRQTECEHCQVLRAIQGCEGVEPPFGYGPHLPSQLVSLWVNLVIVQSEIGPSVVRLMGTQIRCLLCKHRRSCHSRSYTCDHVKRSLCDLSVLQQ